MSAKKYNYPDLTIVKYTRMIARSYAYNAAVKVFAMSRWRTSIIAPNRNSSDTYETRYFGSIQEVDISTTFLHLSTHYLNCRTYMFRID